MTVYFFTLSLFFYAIFITLIRVATHVAHITDYIHCIWSMTNVKRDFRDFSSFLGVRH